MAADNAVRAQEWWLAGLHVGQAWRMTEGSGVTVAVLGTGVTASHPDLGGDVITGPDYSGSGRAPGGPFWGIEGTAVAGVIAGHGHGTGGQSGIVGIAPEARILTIRVTLEYNDPLNSDPAIARRLPDAIAAGIRYAVDHGARVIDLPLDPGTLGLTAQGDPAAAGGSAAEQAAVAYALHQGIVLVAPAGDDSQGPGIVNYPAAYSGVIAVGAVGRNGQLASFSSRRSYVSLTAPGADLVAAAPPVGYGQISTTGTASAMVAGVAALILSRFPHLTVAQVTRALAGSTALTATGGAASAGATSGASLPPLPARSAAGTGYGTLNAAQAVDLAALITSPRRLSAPPARLSASPARPAKPARQPLASPSKASAGALAGSLVRYVVAGLIILIVLLGVMLVVMRARRTRGEPTTGQGRARARGLHEHRRPPKGQVPGQDAEPGPSLGADPGHPHAGGWQAQGGWQGGSLGEIAHVSRAPFRPAIAPAPKGTASPRGGRDPSGSGSSAGPPWEPAPAPERMPGPLPMVSSNLFTRDSGPGIRVPRDMPAPPAANTDPAPPAFDFTAPAATFDFVMPPAPSFAPRPAVTDSSVAAADPDFPTRPDLPAGPDLPTQQSLDFAAAPVPTDYAAPPVPADYAVHHEAPQAPGFTTPLAVPNFTAPPAASGFTAPPITSIWDLAATDVFPISTDPGTQEAPGAVSSNDAPGASDS